MKKILFSTWLKSIAVCLFLAGLILGTFAGIQGAQFLTEEDNFIYDVGSSLENSWYFRHLLSLPENAVLGSLHELTYIESYYNDYGFMDETEPTVAPSPHSTVLNGEEELRLLEMVGDRLNDLPYLDYIEYYVNLNGTTFTNTTLNNPDNLTNGIFHRYDVDQYGNEGYQSSLNIYAGSGIYDYGVSHIKVDPLIIATRIRPEYVKECAVLWEKQESILYKSGAEVLVCGLVSILCLVYLICVCGKDGRGNRVENWVDRIWVELHILFIGALGFGCIMGCIWVIESAFEGSLPIDTAYLLPGIMILLAGSGILCSLLSLIRNLKAGVFARRSCILFLLKYLLKGLCFLCKALWKGLRRLGGILFSGSKIPIVIVEIGLLLLYTVIVVMVVAIATYGNEWLLLALIPIFGTASCLLAWVGSDLDRIEKGASQIRRGDLTHEIPRPDAPHLRPLAENINHIAKGLDTSLAARMKAERMKTELITNVSHDLKTPLTSIITYTELLSRVEGLPEEAKDYVKIIGDKSQRLKSLTQDLFDMSRARSGNEEVCRETLDAALLLEQSLAEETDQIPEETLRFCLKTQENLTFMGDGRKLSRVLGNLLQNTVKYAQPGTRVFLSAYEEGDQVVIECKNTSAHPLDFDPEEILGRFVRGDSARSTEGNGLGLPIAKSYTELCGGTFCLTLDGDLFKVRLFFPKSK